MEQFNDLMTNFQSGSLIGVDIGLSSIKVCELSGSSGKFKVEAFSIRTLSEAAIIDDEIQKPEEIITTLEDCLADIQTKKKIAALGIDGPNTMTKRMNVPDGSKEDVENNVLWEAEQFIPFGVDESEMDYHIIGEMTDEEDILDVLVVAAKIPVIEDFQNILKVAGLKTRVVDMKALSLINAFEEAYKDELEKYNQGTAVIDFGAQKTSIIIYKNGGPSLTKEIGIGGVLITEEVQRQMGLSYSEAESLKISGTNDGQYPEELAHIIKNHIEDLISELRKVLNFYISPGSADQIGQIMITGGSSTILGLKEELKEAFEVKVERINFTRSFALTGRVKNQRAAIDLIGGVVLGLAMRKV
jgi:type IV pilus assembly protein PilM